MSLTNGQVASRFADRSKGNGGNMSTDGRVIKSYSAVIGQWLEAEDNLRDNKAVVILNGDRYSVTSSQHLGQLRNLSNITVSFSALNAAGLAWESGRRQSALNAGVQLVAFEKDLHVLAYEGNKDYSLEHHLEWEASKDLETSEERKEVQDKFGPLCDLEGPRYETILDNIPIGATPFDVGKRYSVEKSHFNGPVTRRHKEEAYRGYHRAGTVILRYQGFDYLCGFDERSYFVSKLPRQVTSVEDAYAALLPQEAQGRYFLRQGEWFFIETDLQALMAEKFPLLEGLLPYTFNRFKKDSVSEPLPRTTDRSNPHTVTYLVKTGENFFAAGTVRHPEHRMLRLGKGKVYQAYRNNSLGDWSSQGFRVD